MSYILLTKDSVSLSFASKYSISFFLFHKKGIEVLFHLALQLNPISHLLAMSDRLITIYLLSLFHF